MAELNAEIRRELIEAMGSDNFFKQYKAKIIHSDIDGCGNTRELLRVPSKDTEVGYFQAVKVVCPTTKRVYYLGVPPTVTNCQDAVASTFGMKGSQYNPNRES